MEPRAFSRQDLSETQAGSRPLLNKSTEQGAVPIVTRLRLRGGEVRLQHLEATSAVALSARRRIKECAAYLVFSVTRVRRAKRLAKIQKRTITLFSGQPRN